MIEKEVRNIKYGTLTFNVVLRDGVALMRTMKIVRSRRKRYQIGNSLDKKLDK